jgi:hypothetical protein
LSEKLGSCMAVRSTLMSRSSLGEYLRKTQENICARLENICARLENVGR